MWTRIAITTDAPTVRIIGVLKISEETDKATKTLDMTRSPGSRHHLLKTAKDDQQGNSGEILSGLQQQESVGAHHFGLATGP
ncbi:hypothetical protein Y1Q_0012896 [Alligator mississippiensis]|uniref:Uncharacterized protein n=1 Tax=Alligator mississippiensis TaxID=8496 RepID=A0A151P5B5_ALLMI|nr:hypothetical protein Y1Q_0012896 [Alligator mississippiensis]